MEIFIIPLIALAVWILQYIFRGPEENNKQQPGRPRPAAAPQRPAGPRPRRPVTDLDRYLEETRRRRVQGEDRPPPIEVAPERSARDEALERERRRVAAPKPPPPPPPRVVPVPPQRTLQPIAEPLRPVVAEIVPVAVPVQSPINARTEQAATMRGAELAAPQVDSRRREERRVAATPVQKELARLLRAPQGLAAALVLQEIFGEPLCRRKR